MFFFVLIIIAIVIVAAARSGSTKTGRNNTTECGRKPTFYERITMPDEKVAGNEGEKEATRKIQKIMNSDDWLFTHLEIPFNGEYNEMDDVIVNEYGVFIVEVKDWNGEIKGRENDDVWIQTKETYPGQEYENAMSNPIGQVKWQVHVLRSFLRENGVNAWVSGKVWMLQDNCSVRSNMVLGKKREVDDFIHTVGSPKGYMLDEETIERIKHLFHSQVAQNSDR